MFPLAEAASVARTSGARIEVAGTRAKKSPGLPTVGGEPVLSPSAHANSAPESPTLLKVAKTKGKVPPAVGKVTLRVTKPKKCADPVSSTVDTDVEAQEASPSLQVWTAKYAPLSDPMANVLMPVAEAGTERYPVNI